MRQRPSTRRKMLTAATVAPTCSPIRFSSTVTQAISPATWTRSSVRMNCRCCGPPNSANHDPATAPHPCSVFHPGWVHDDVVVVEPDVGHRVEVTRLERLVVGAGWPPAPSRCPRSPASPPTLPAPQARSRPPDLGRFGPPTGVRCQHGPMAPAPRPAPQVPSSDGVTRGPARPRRRGSAAAAVPPHRVPGDDLGAARRTSWRRRRPLLGTRLPGPRRQHVARHGRPRWRGMADDVLAVVDALGAARRTGGRPLDGRRRPRSSPSSVAPARSPGCGCTSRSCSRRPRGPRPAATRSPTAAAPAAAVVPRPRGRVRQLRRRSRPLDVLDPGRAARLRRPRPARPGPTATASS